MVGAGALDQILGGEKVFAAGAVEAGIAPLENVARAERVPELGHAAAVSCFRGAHEAVVADAQARAQLAVVFSSGIDPDERGNASDAGGFDVLEGVLVGPGLKAGRVSGGDAPSSDGVGLDEFEGEADVRSRIHVRNGGGDVGGRGHLLGAWKQKKKPRRVCVWAI